MSTSALSSDYPRSRERLNALLHEYNEEPDRRAEIESEISRTFERNVAILALDSSGFSRTTRLRGIVHFLALLERLERTVRPIVLQHHGRILRTEADNIFAVFESIDDALGCATAIVRALDAANELLPAQDEVYVSIGLGWGPVLMVGDDDLFGDEMNLTCKLGEDLAQRREILLTPAARAGVSDASREFEELCFTISGLDVTAFRLKL